MRGLLAAVALLAVAGVGLAEVVTTSVTYTVDAFSVVGEDVGVGGTLVHDSSFEAGVESNPGVVIVPDFPVADLQTYMMYASDMVLTKNATVFIMGWGKVLLDDIYDTNKPPNQQNIKPYMTAYVSAAVKELTSNQWVHPNLTTVMGFGVGGAVAVSTAVSNADAPVQNNIPGVRLCISIGGTINLTETGGTIATLYNYNTPVVGNDLDDNPYAFRGLAQKGYRPHVVVVTGVTDEDFSSIRELNDMYNPSDDLYLRPRGFTALSYSNLAESTCSGNWWSRVVDGGCNGLVIDRMLSDLGFVYDTAVLDEDPMEDYPVNLLPFIAGGDNATAAGYQFAPLLGPEWDGPKGNISTMTYSSSYLTDVSSTTPAVPVYNYIAFTSNPQPLDPNKQVGSCMTAGCRPGVMIIPDAKGVSAFEMRKCQELANEHGVICMVVDQYGPWFVSDGNLANYRPDDPNQKVGVKRPQPPQVLYGGAGAELVERQLVEGAADRQGNVIAEAYQTFIGQKTGKYDITNIAYTLDLVDPANIAIIAYGSGAIGATNFLNRGLGAVKMAALVQPVIATHDFRIPEDQQDPAAPHPIPYSNLTAAQKVNADALVKAVIYSSVDSTFAADNLPDRVQTARALIASSGVEPDLLLVNNGLSKIEHTQYVEDPLFGTNRIVSQTGAQVSSDIDRLLEIYIAGP
eukprot:CAMPEP_0182878382 /NCGR_PEP_ID=MMETSP0034_2-20130328/15319_1 /TAXON_ID=156128 /ORGANISM="Nephroselmis pyriformis, Strain CCMP717" /LENGTH=684 /DNA_ID=CAMNT_0025011265 /DNA_START=43 /DNA_END=2094 /DNA_ORIENTATION=-